MTLEGLLGEDLVSGKDLNGFERILAVAPAGIGALSKVKNAIKLGEIGGKVEGSISFGMNGGGQLDNIIGKLRESKAEEDMVAKEAVAIDKTSYVESIADLKNVENFKQGTKSNALNHIFDGEIIDGEAVGFHYENMPNTQGKVIGDTDYPNQYGVYQANIEVNGVAKKAKSTFFPKEWTPQQVVDSINEAFANKVVFKNNRYRGTTSKGITIEMIIKKDKIVSAYPLY